MRDWVGDLAIMLGAFAAGTAIAAGLGAANFGTALSFGQIAFAIALVWVLVRRHRGRREDESRPTGARGAARAAEPPSRAGAASKPPPPPPRARSRQAAKSRRRK